LQTTPSPNHIPTTPRGGLEDEDRQTIFKL